MPKAIDITGQIFGDLQAISKAESRNGKTYWLCKCLLCGNLKEIQTSHLTSGATKTCGCGFSVTNPYNLKKECALCGKIFIPNTYTREYCYDCLPENLSRADAIRTIKRSTKHKLIEYKGGKCQKCGYNKCEGALQFHHRDKTQKEFTLSQVNLNKTKYSINELLKEADKCDLLCANCHAEEHYIND